MVASAGYACLAAFHVERYESVTEYRFAPQALTREAFAPFGDVIETRGASHFPINRGAVERFHDLARVDVGAAPEGRGAISMARCTTPTVAPVRVQLVERHMLGSQAFIPLSIDPFLVVVAPLGDTVDATQLQAFVSNGSQGINYASGTWHAPLMAMVADQEFIVVDRIGPGDNCEEWLFDASDEIFIVTEP